MIQCAIRRPRSLTPPEDDEAEGDGKEEGDNEEEDADTGVDQYQQGVPYDDEDEEKVEDSQDGEDEEGDLPVKVGRLPEAWRLVVANFSTIRRSLEGRRRPGASRSGAGRA